MNNGRLKMTIKRNYYRLFSLMHSLRFTRASKLWGGAYGEKNDLTRGAVFSDAEGHKRSSVWFRSRRPATVTVDFGSEKTFDTVLIREPLSAVRRFCLYVGNDPLSLTKVFEGDKIEAFRLCRLKPTSARYVMLSVESSSGSYYIKDMAVCLSEKKQSTAKFRLTEYVVIGNVSETMDVEPFLHVTDVIFFGGARYDARGNVLFTTAPDNNPKNDEDFAKKLNILKKALAGRGIKLRCEILFPLKTAEFGEKDTSVLCRQNSEAAAANTAAFIEKYGFDGLDLDYEYPWTKKEWKAYDSFIAAVRKKMPTKQLSLAVSAWNIRLCGRKTVKNVDIFELMSYDRFDADGYHATFMTACRDVAVTLKYIPAEKIDLGVPFYSRPLLKEAYWGDYKDDAATLGVFGSLVTEPVLHDGKMLTSHRYYNCYQMIVDKTAMAIDIGLGGMMVWHYACDLLYSDKLSLARAIVSTKES